MRNESMVLSLIAGYVAVLCGGCVLSEESLNEPVLGEVSLATSSGDRGGGGGGFGSGPRCTPIMPIGNGGGGGSCTPDDCGENTGEVNGYPVPELYLEYGVPNTAGVSVTGFLDPSGAPAPLFAEHGRLYTISGGLLLEGEALVGGKILIERAGVPDVIVIYDYQKTETWTGSGGLVDNYLFTYADEADGLGPGDDTCDFRLPVCSGVAGNGDEALAWATVLTNERYQLDTGHRVLPSVFQSPAPMWFNITCQGHAQYKARHWEYYPDTGNPATFTTVHDREAMTRSIINDACGADMSFTENGATVAWRNETGTVNIPAGWNLSELEVESIWDENGATCLTQSRLAMSVDKIDAHCPALLGTECPDVHEAVSNLAAYGKIVTLVPKAP